MYVALCNTKEEDDDDDDDDVMTKSVALVDLEEPFVVCIMSLQ